MLRSLNITIVVVVAVALVVPATAASGGDRLTPEQKRALTGLTPDQKREYATRYGFDAAPSSELQRAEAVPLTVARAFAGSSGDVGSLAATWEACWGATTSRARGVYPYGRALHLYTMWCGRNWIITYRTSSAWVSHDFLCHLNSGPHTARVAGGLGWSWVDVQAWATYGCHSPWWFEWNDTLLQRIRYHANGYYQLIHYQ